MATAFSSLMLLFLLICSLLWLSCLGKTQTVPKQIVLPVYKDAYTLQYVTKIQQRTPLVSVLLILDLGGQSLWTDCETGYVSSSIHSGGCGTPQCRLAQGDKFCSPCSWNTEGPACTKTRPTCPRYTFNPVARYIAGGEVVYDVVAINSTDGKGPGNVVTVPDFLFLCAQSTIVVDLAEGVTGMAGLGRSRISFPVQLAKKFKLERKFGLCLSSSTSNNGVVVFGDGPYNNLNHSAILMYTSLIINKVNFETAILKGEASHQYYIGVKSVRINDKAVKINTTLLVIDDRGFRGTRISTVLPYTMLRTSIYKPVAKAFVDQLNKNVTRVAPVAPFGTCFSSKNIGSTRVGPAVPTIDIVMEEDGVYWRMFGANSMVRVNKNVLCLGFVDAGESDYLPGIEIGGHQLEDNWLTFDLDKSKLGFSSSLLFRKTTCSNFRL